MSLKSPKAKYRGELRFEKAFKEIGSVVSFNSDSIKALKSYITSMWHTCKCRPAQVVIMENKATYPNFDWQEIECVDAALLNDNEKTENRLRLGKKIADMRMKKNISVRKLADMTGYAASNISKIENGKYNVSIDIISKICKALGGEIDINELLPD